MGNKDQVEGRLKESGGKIQEIAGKAVGSTTQELKGKIKKNIGKAQAGYGDAKERDREEAKHEAEDHRP